MAYWIINTTIFMTIITGILFIIIKIAVPKINKKRAYKALDKILFPNGNSQKNKVIDAFRKITQRKFTNEEILDFFIKEKGIQFMSIDPDFSSFLKKYLMIPTLVELNYFEKVKFHETFINYPRNFETVNSKIENSEIVFELLQDNKTPAFLAKEGYAS